MATLYDGHGNAVTLSSGGTDNEYFVTDYGITLEAEDNTDALNSLIDMVSNAGGGTIFFPPGTYKFRTTHANFVHNANYYNVALKNNVSICGSGQNATVLHYSGDTQQGATLFGAFGGDENPLVGCIYSDFAVDMSEQTVQTYSHKGKAFFVHGIKDCVFRDLRLLSTPSTALGIDMLDNVVMDSIYVYQGGREWDGGNGGAGIGIGTGLWENENYIIRNCVCVGCGHFGIFIEDQGLFDSSKIKNYPKGQIICNNIVRGGRYYGIGVRGGKNVLVEGNNLYENVGGLYIDYGAKNVLFAGNLVQGSTEAGFCFASTHYACENISIIGNSFLENAVGIKKAMAPTSSIEQNNSLIGNTVDEQ